MNRPAANQNAAVEMKGRMMALTVLRAMTNDLHLIEAELRQRLERAPNFYQGMPLLLEPGDSAIDVEAVASLVRRLGLVLVAVYDPDPEQAEAAARAGLGIISAARGSGGKAPGRTTGETPPEAPPARGDKPRPAARLVTDVVRSGQQIYARGTDLVVMNAVSPGAEVIADGCIHVYGPLRGRALAGALGDTSARIFCQSLEAELLAVAGQYRVADDIDRALHRLPVQIHLHGDVLEIASLRSPKIHTE